MGNLSRTGRTTRTIESFPEDGIAVFIVHSQHMIAFAKNMIEEIWGPNYLTKNLQVVSAGSANTTLRGLNKPIFVDHCVWEYSPIRMIEEIREHMRRCND